jgi:2-desacetyl-2-hydroxyethyl bacteriochlorophyllide A dehydrogenase
VLRAQRDEGYRKQPSQGWIVSALALWTVGPGQAELRPAEPGPPADGQVQVRALVSGISRGTERLVFHGQVPPSERERMRCPLQEGQFPYPVKYGYAMVGAVEAGPPDLIGRRVFGLHPHQSLFNAPAGMLVPVPDAVTTERAALAPQMETALNATWDAGLQPGESVAVVGGGVIGLLTAWLAAKTCAVVLIDVNPARREIAEALGVGFALPGEARGGRRTVYHASSTSEGLNLAFQLCAFEGQVIELSWFGDKPVTVDLGGAFHSQRLTLRASQVGTVAASHRKGWSHRGRLAEALSLCADPRLDVLVQAETPFAEMPSRMSAILDDPDTLCHLIRYS